VRLMRPNGVHYSGMPARRRPRSMVSLNKATAARSGPSPCCYRIIWRNLQNALFGAVHFHCTPAQRRPNTGGLVFTAVQPKK
jgi:hypothetical protein